jgi:predicted CoA-substrate-specific enzyme activase
MKKNDHPPRSNHVYVGIDAGSVSINGIVINGEKEIVYNSPYTRHFGKVQESFLTIMGHIFKEFGEERVRDLSFTGNHGKNMAAQLDAFYEFETISQVMGALFVEPETRTIISMGGQDTAFIQISHGDDGWELEHFNTNGPCAAGTGSFIDQQAARMATAMYQRQSDVSQDHIDRVLADFIALGSRSRTPSKVACRCTVFTKSDMIHLQNKGERLEDIIYGLHMGNARNYISNLVTNRSLEEPILFIGGLSLNAIQVAAFREYFPDLKVPDFSTSLGALGVALLSLERGHENHVDMKRLHRSHEKSTFSVATVPRLQLNETHFPESNVLLGQPLKKGTHTYLGLDVGSTTTKYALINEDKELIHKRYVPTQGKPIEVTQHLLRFIKEAVGESAEIAGVATTGSGRIVVADFINADLAIDEITAHARGAVEIDPHVDTIFEIGGQDSKYISITDTYPLDFEMNKVCAAGTGSFLHELANKHGINIVSEFQRLALSSENPVKLAERCTVFMESDLVSYRQKGVDIPDLIAGLCYAIVYNYLNRVVAKGKIGRKVMFLGGPSLNKAVVAAFENVLGRGLIVPRHREVLGAYGAALRVREKMLMERSKRTRFRGLESAIHDKMTHKETICPGDGECHNQCKLKIYDFDGRQSIWGGDCGRYESTGTKGPVKENYFLLREKIWQKHMKGVFEQLKGSPLMDVGGRPTIGMQRGLYGIQTAVFWAHFFDQLGYRLVLTPPTNARIEKMGVQLISVEACYPVKVSHGHIKALKGMTSYLFIPTLVNMPTPHEGESGFYCPMVQHNSYMVRPVLGLDESTILNPLIHLKDEPDLLALEITEQIKEKLGVHKTSVRKALSYAFERDKEFKKELHSKGKEILRVQKSLNPVLVVTGRHYNLYDERLNLRLGRNLSKLGFTAIPMDFIDVSAVDLSDFPTMYWGLGAQILRTARFVKVRPNFFCLHLTNFGCGADSFIEHFYKHIMAEKPCLFLELDEHTAAAGMMTRLEAYKNVIENMMQETPSYSDVDLHLAN